MASRVVKDVDASCCPCVPNNVALEIVVHRLVVSDADLPPTYVSLMLAPCHHVMTRFRCTRIFSPWIPLRVKQRNHVR